MMDMGTLTESGSVPINGIHKPERLSWIPWRWIRSQHSSGTGEELAALFNAYQYIHSLLDINRIRSMIPARDQNDPCHRCGRCCAELLPEPVSQDIVLRWIDTGNLAHLFHVPITEGPLAGSCHTGWYFDNVRLRMCPLLLYNPATRDYFCVVYHFGLGHRPPACEGFKPNWPHCEVSQRSLVP